MKRVTITELQRSIGALSIDLIRGEEIILTRNGRDLARLVPVEPKLPKPTQKSSNLPKEPEAVEGAPVNFPPALKPPANVQRRCEAPGVVCRLSGSLYLIEYTNEEGLAKREAYLCPIHAARARGASESVTKI